MGFRNNHNSQTKSRVLRVHAFSFEGCYLHVLLTATNILNFQLPILNLLSDGHSTDETVFYTKSFFFKQLAASLIRKLILKKLLYITIEQINEIKNDYQTNINRIN